MSILRRSYEVAPFSTKTAAVITPLLGVAAVAETMGAFDTLPVLSRVGVYAMAVCLDATAFLQIRHNLNQADIATSG